MPLRQRFETLLLFDPNRSPSTANVWISHPSPSEEQALGKLIAVANVAGTDRSNLDVINLIQEELRIGYYQSLDSKPERAFEQALQQTNRRLHSVITDGVSSWVDSANIMLAAVWRDTIVISGVGNIHAFLLRRGRMHDLLGSSETATINPVRIFSHVITGQLQTDDQLLFCTPSLLDYFSLEKLRRTMADGSPSAAIHAWESTLLGVEQQTSFGAIIIQLVASEVVQTAVGRPVAQGTLVQSAPQVSMDHLIAKEQATERLLSPSVWPAVRDVVTQVTGAIRRVIRQIILRKPPRRTVPTNHAYQALPQSNGQTYRQRFIRIVNAGWQRLIGVLQLFRPRRTLMQTSPPPVTMAPTLRKKWRFSLNGIVGWFQRLSKQRQVLFGTTMLLLFILAISILPKSKPQTNSSSTSGNVTIAELLTKAQAALLYGGEDTAQQHLDQAENLYKQLPNRSSKDKAARTSARTAIDKIITQLAHQTVIPNPTVVTQLAAVAPLAQPQQLYLVGTKLITVDPNKNIVTSFTLGKNSPVQIITNQLDIGTPVTGTVSSASSVLFATDRRGFIELDLAKNVWKPIDSAWPTTAPQIQSIAIYQNRVYALDIAGKSIVRFARSTNSLGTGIPWLKEAAQIGSGRGLAIDGSIYILQPQGNVDLFTNGRKSTFTVTPVHPPLTEATRLWTDASSTNIYLVDSSKNRIIVLSKTGKLVDQYTSPSWPNLTDIAVSEKTKTAYVLSGTTISSFTLIH